MLANDLKRLCKSKNNFTTQTKFALVPKWQWLLDSFILLFVMLLLVSFVWFIWKKWRTASQPSRDLSTNTTDNIVEAKHSRHAEKCMNSTGRWVHGMTKLGTDCNHRDTAWNEKRTSWELFLTVKWIGPLMDRIKKYKVSWKKKTKQNPWCDSLMVLLDLEKWRSNRGCFSFSGGGKVSQFSVLHNNQIPHACAEETS